MTDAVGRVTRRTSAGDGVLWWIGWSLAQEPQAGPASWTLDLPAVVVEAVEVAGRPRWRVRLAADPARARSYEVQLTATPAAGDGVAVVVRAEVGWGDGAWAVQPETAWSPGGVPALQAALADAAGRVPEARVAPAPGGGWSLGWVAPTDDEVVTQVALTLWEGLRGLTLALPDGAVGPGTTWTARRALALPWGGTLQESLGYEVVGRDGRAVQVRVTRRAAVDGEHGYQEELAGSLWLDTRWWLPTAARLEGTVTTPGPDDAPQVDRLSVTVASVEVARAR